jgi:hypothetical protein
MFATTLTKVAPARNERQLGTLGAFFYRLRETMVHVHVILAVSAALGAYFASGTIFMSSLKHWLDHRRARKTDPSK